MLSCKYTHFYFVQVLSQYLAQGGDPRDASENAAIAKFTKKLSKNSRLSVENNLVLLQP